MLFRNTIMIIELVLLVIILSNNLPTELVLVFKYKKLFIVSWD